MNNPLSDGNENFKDIFVLGRSEAGTLDLMEQLENQDYRVTLFSDGPQLIDTLGSGRPNLIICDTTSFGPEAYEYCRQIKSDDNLWMIPVMILTRASSLGDLLYVLDSNADNFIAQPYDPPYLLSLIEGMLLTPVEQPTTEQIKTQFKIQHDDQIFVVTADRRKLLEFLLSAFEIAVKNSEDLSSAQAELQEHTTRLVTLEDAAVENAREIGKLSAGIKKKEQDERILKEDLEETEQALDEKTAKAGQLTRDLGDARTLLATAEDHIRILVSEKEQSDLAHQSEISLLTGKVSSISQEISAKTTELDATQLALDAEISRSAKLELALQESTEQTDLQKSSLQILTLDKEQLSTALSFEKSRAEAADEKARSVLLAKAQSEQELNQLIDELKEAARQKNEEHLRLKSELEAESARCTSAELQAENLRHELEQSRATYEVTEESQQRQFDDLQARCDTALGTIFTQERELKHIKDELVVAHADVEKSAASLVSVTTSLNEARREIEEREWKAQSLEKQIADAGKLKETSDENVRVLSTSLENIQSEMNAEKERYAVLEEKYTTAIRERDENLRSLHSAHNETRTDLELQKNNLIQLNCDLEAAAQLRTTLQGDITAASFRIKDLEHDLKSALLAKDETSQQVQKLSGERDEVKATLDEALSALSFEKEQREAAVVQLNAAICERDETLESVRGAHDQTKTDLDVQRQDLQRLNDDLEAATRLNSTHLADFKAASDRISDLEAKLNSVVQGKEQTTGQVRLLSDDLERTNAELETERKIRCTAEESQEKSAQVIRSLEGEITRITAEQKQLVSSLEQEKVLHAEALEKVCAATRAKEHAEDEFKTVKEEYEQEDNLHAAKIQKLTRDFEEVLARQQVLEQEVKTLESQKAEADARAESLSDEIEQARIALADEWEDHMNDEERLAASEKEKVLQDRSPLDSAISERERKWAVVVKQTDLPAEIRSVPKAVVVTSPTSPTRTMPVPPAVPDTHPEGAFASGIEDLFEDEEPVPTVDTSGLVTDEENPVKPDSVDERETEQDADEAEDVDEVSGEDEEEPENSLDDFVTIPSSYGISFNRQQWFDLLKWSHHSGALSQDQRMQIVRMGRLLQRGRKLTAKQDEQVREMLVLVQTLGYKFH